MRKNNDVLVVRLSSEEKAKLKKFAKENYSSISTITKLGLTKIGAI